MRRRRRRHVLAVALWVYKRALVLYPRDFRRAYGADMAQVFGDLCRDACRRGGMPTVFQLFATTLVDLTISVPREHTARLRHPVRRRGHRATPAAAALAALARHGSPLRRPTMAHWPHVPHWLGSVRHWRRPGAGPSRRRPRYGSDRRNFDKFTSRAKRVLSLAQEEAQRLHHTHIGTEHLLLGLIREHDGVAGEVLRRLGVDVTQARGAVEDIIGRRDQPPAPCEIGLTPRSKHVIELAVDESRRMSHQYIGTEHLLLGLLREGDGIAWSVLQGLGLQLGAVRQATLDALREHEERT